MKTKSILMFMLLIFAVGSANTLQAQNAYKHPHLNASGHVLDSTGVKLGWVTKEGIVYNAQGEKVASIKNNELHDPKGKRMGTIDKNGTYHNDKGAVVFTIDTNDKGEKCRVYDPQGKVIATVHEGYKNQACAIHCLYTKMPPH